MSNYFNTLTLREKLEQLGKCRFMDASEFEDGVNALVGKKIVRDFGNANLILWAQDIISN